MRDSLFSLFFKILSFLKSQILKIILFLLVFPIFLLILSPYKSLVPWLKDQIYIKTKGSVQVSYQEIKTPLFPPSIILKNFKIDYKSQNIQSGDLKIKVQLLDLLKLSFSVFMELNELLNSQLKLKISYGLMPFFSIDLKDLKLDLLSYFFSEIYGISGKMSLNAKLSGWFYDPLKKGFIRLQAKDIELPEISMNSSLGALKLSSLSFKSLKMDSLIKDKKLQINEFYLGDKKDPLFLEIKGFLALNKNTTNPIKSYKLQVKIEADYEALDVNTRNYLSLLDKYKKDEGLKSVFSFLIESSSLTKPPSLKAL